MTSLSEWQVFYEIVGSAAGALTGLQFLVMALISDLPSVSEEHTAGENQTSEAFATPTIVHFVAVLFTAASAAMPWHSLAPAAVVWALAGFSGLVYTLLVLRRMRRQPAYKPVFEDWLFHVMLPCCAYAGLATFAIVVPLHARQALFGIAAMALLLLVSGIHNAWDNVLFLVALKRQRLREGPSSRQP